MNGSAQAGKQEQWAWYTKSVVDAIGKNASPRVKQAFPVLIKKLHEAVIETGFTIEEWMATCELLIEAGKVSSDKRNEMILVSDVLGIESLVDMMEHERFAAAGSGNATASAILGPFYRTGVDTLPFGASILKMPEPEGEFAHVFGTVHDKEGKPLAGATVDVWHDAPDGFYDSQSPDKPNFHCRGRFITNDKGEYSYVSLKPTPYPIPFDHSAGKLLKLMDRHPYRPAHIHYYVEAPGHKTLVTQVFPHDSDYLKDDSVFAVKDDLIVKFQPIETCPKPKPRGGEHDGPLKFWLEYNIELAPDSVVPETKFQG